MNHKIIKMHLSTWRRLRAAMPAESKDETADHYFRRVAIELNEIERG